MLVSGLILVFSMGYLADLFISTIILDKDSTLLHRVFTVHKRWNKIYRCKSCRKLSREYQGRIYDEITGEKHRCPQCERVSYRPEKIKEEKWMNSHPDCPKISFLGCFKVRTTIKKIRKNKKLIASQKFFEEYNKIEVGFSWIENLQNKYK